MAVGFVFITRHFITMTVLMPQVHKKEAGADVCRCLLHPACDWSVLGYCGGTHVRVS